MKATEVIQPLPSGVTEPEEDLIILDSAQSVVSFESYREQYERYEQDDCIAFL